MTILISDNSPRISYTATAGQTAFTVPFEFFDASDLNVYINDTLQTLTTHYTVTGGSGSTGSITLGTGATLNDVIVITRDVTLERVTDFPTSGPFQVASLNTELDKVVAMIADMKDLADRGLRLSDSDTSATLVLANKDTRKGTVLAFNEVTGAVEVGPTIADTNTVAQIKADIATVAGISANVTTVAGISSNVTTVANNDANVTTVAGQTTNMQNVTDNLTAIQNAATNATTATTKATEAAASATAASTSETNAATSETNAATSATNASNSASAASTSASASATSATASANSATAAATSETNAGTSETNAATSATNAATSETNAATSATNSSSSATAAATSATNAATSATNAATSATAASGSATAAANSAAAAAAAFDNFDDTYLGSFSSDPTVDNDGDALVEGALYFNSSANEMRVYDGANWIAASSAGTASILEYNYTATAGQTTFTGSDDNSATLSYTAANLMVTLNGIVLENGTDYAATNGTSIVLTVSAAAGDELNIIAFKSFTVSDTVAASTGGTFNGSVAVNGDLTVDTDTLYVDSTNDRVGIGTNSPVTALDVTGTVTADGLDLGGTTDSATVSNTSSDYQIQLGAAQSTTGDIGRNISFGFGGTTTAAINSIDGGTSNAQSLGFFTGNGTSLSERLRIDSSGNLLVGQSSADNTVAGVSARFDGRLFATRDSDQPAFFNRLTNDGSIIEMAKDNTTVGSIGSYSTGTRVYIGSGDTGLVFGQDVGTGDAIFPMNPSTNGIRDNAIDLGVSNARFDDIYATNGTIQTSDQNEKQQIASLTNAEITAAKAISKLFKTFKWNDKVEAKGDAARTHTGVIAQDVQQAMTDAGLDAGDYAFFISATWWETQTEVPAVEAVEENGIEAADAYTRTDTYETAEEAPEGATERTRLGIRYPELLAFVGAATEQRLADIETRLTALEAN